MIEWSKIPNNDFALTIDHLLVYSYGVKIAI